LLHGGGEGGYLQGWLGFALQNTEGGREAYIHTIQASGHTLLDNVMRIKDRERH